MATIDGHETIRCGICATPCEARLRFDTYFLGHDGMWRLHHSFCAGTDEENERNALAAAETLSAYGTATVNEVGWCSVTGRVLWEVQIAEVAREGAA